MTGLRYYQQEACDSVLEQLGLHRSTMVVAATGTGKTRIFTAIAKEWKGRVLVLAHRAELVTQAATSLREHCQEAVEIEQAGLRSDRARIVVASVQSICQDHRLQRIGREGFSLVIVDEVHRYLAKTFRKVIDWFHKAKILGVTATADRGDKKALGAIMDTVAYKMDIQEGIHSGYLVPLKIGRVHLASIDLRGVNKVRGDLHEGKLEKVMLKNVGAVVQKTVELHPDRQAILFFPGLESAELASQQLNVRKPGTAIFISGKTDKEERKQLVDDFRDGKYQYLCNCQTMTEGFDAPLTSLIVIARPTTSRSLYTQMVGRGTRVIGECVADINGKELADERRAAIAWSEKPDCVVLDFVGNSGKHSLISPLDLLGGDYTDEEQRAAKAELEVLDEEEPVDPEQLLSRARKRLEARDRALRAIDIMVHASVSYVDPFECLGMDMQRVTADELLIGRVPISNDTRRTLESFGVDSADARKMSQAQGIKLLRGLFARKNFGMATYPQMQLLKKWGVTTSKVYQRQAQAAIGYLAECEYGNKTPVSKEKLNLLAKGNGV